MSDAINMLARRVKELEAQVASMQAEAPQATKDAVVEAAIVWYNSSDKSEPEHELAMAILRLLQSRDAARKSQGEAP